MNQNKEEDELSADQLKVVKEMIRKLMLDRWRSVGCTQEAAVALLHGNLEF